MDPGRAHRDPVARWHVGYVDAGVKNRLEPKDVSTLAERPRRYGKGIPLVVAALLSPMAIQRLRGAGIADLDLAGNARAAADRPGLFVETQTAQRDPWARGSASTVTYLSRRLLDEA